MEQRANQRQLIFKDKFKDQQRRQKGYIPRRRKETTLADDSGDKLFEICVRDITLDLQRGGKE